MIFRRIKTRVENENWFAVGIDFCIVVIGVFIGIQVANWNEARAERLSESQYLDRLAEEVQLTLDRIQQERKFAEEAVITIEQFSKSLFQDDLSDTEMLNAIRAYFTKGVLFSDFKPVRTSFDDLTATGNIDIISDTEIRSNLVLLYAQYDDVLERVQTNIDWVQQGEALVYYGTDAMRFSTRTEALFDQKSPTEQIQDIKQNRDVIRRQAALHYWVKDRTLELYDQIEPQARVVLDLIHSGQAAQ